MKTSVNREGNGDTFTTVISPLPSVENYAHVFVRLLKNIFKVDCKTVVCGFTEQQLGQIQAQE